MRKILLTFLALCFAASAYAQLPLTGAGKGTSGVALYTGPGNVVSGATGWWGLRAYSTADRGNRLINVCNVADVACADLSSDAVTGALVITTIGGSSCSVVTCTIKTFYDRSGNANDVTQATISKRPTLTVSCISSLPCAAYTNGAVTVLAKAGGPTVAQPFTYSAVAIRTGAFTTFGPMIATNNGADGEMAFANGGQIVHLYCSNTATHLTSGTTPDSVWYAFQGVCNNTSSVLAINGTEVSGSAGASSFSGTILVGNDNATSLTGNMTETGIWPSAFSAGNRTSMTSNQRAYWGI